MRVRYLVALVFGALLLAVVATPSARACWWGHQRPYYGPAYYGPSYGPVYGPPVVAAPPAYAIPGPLPPSAGVPTVQAPTGGGQSAPRGGDPLVQRGKYLVLEVAHCDHCHTPQESGKHDESKLLRGATLPIRPKDPKAEWADKSPDITRGGLAGKLGEDAIVKFLMTGKDPAGNTPRPPMPTYHLNEDDARAVARYLLSVGGDDKGGR